jgi:4-nitrophenyl phosphatase
MFEYASGQVSPKIGKPHAPILEEALKYFQLNADEAVILGDNLETDILLGVENHVDTIFVTSGVHQREDVEKLQIYPTRTIDDLRELLAE